MEQGRRVGLLFMATSWGRSNTDRWEKGFAALAKFHAREGHCHPSSRHAEGKFKLGTWVRTQRYYKDNLSVERKRRLRALGFVWNWRDYLWDRGFTALMNFKQREGHCHVPIFHCEGNYRLGWWVSTQRQRRKKLSAKQKARLNKIGFVWKENRGGAAIARAAHLKAHPMQA
jgi:Helicase associated domain